MTYSHKSGANVATKPLDMNSEHDTVKSRLTGHDHEIMFGPLPAAADPSMGGQVPANPFASRAQAGYMHLHPDVLGKTALAEWDRETKGKNLPKHVKK
jgi:hypothetical protein